ncbi:MAG: hypothetical protein E4H33_01515 [Anaerolineales bacterium]|nr:MAG: hypothetical protein E4H33_01515 [Anaerolineales bacterium]
MPIEPTSVQRDKMLVLDQKKRTLVQFLAGGDDFLNNDYLKHTQKATLEEGGERVLQTRIDQVLAGGELPYRYITIDSYPSSESLLMAFENTREMRQAAISDIFAILVKPNPWVPKITRWLGFLTPRLSQWLGTSTEKPLIGFTDQANPDIEPVLETVEILREHNGDVPFLMMNLNKFSPSEWKTRGRISGKSAYQFYSARIMPYLISVGGYPALYGSVLSILIGDKNNPIYENWNDFAMVYYPSRSHFLRLMTNTPKGAAKIRRAGLKKAVLMPCSSIEG